MKVLTSVNQTDIYDFPGLTPHIKKKDTSYHSESLVISYQMCLNNLEIFINKK